MIISGKSPCAICGKTLNEPDKYVLVPGITANEADPLFALNDSAVHESCLATHPGKERLYKRLEMLAEYDKLEVTDFITGEPLTIDRIGHPDNIISTPIFAEDPTDDLYKYNGLLINKMNLDKWSGKDEFIETLKRHDASGNWKGRYLKDLIARLSSPPQPAMDPTLIEKFKKKQGI